MADAKISALAAAGALTGTELIETVQSGVNVKTTTQDIADLGGGAVPDASETVKGIIELATQAETNTGTDDLKSVTPLKMTTYFAANILDDFDFTLLASLRNLYNY